MSRANQILAYKNVHKSFVSLQWKGEHFFIYKYSECNKCFIKAVVAYNFIKENIIGTYC